MNPSQLVWMLAAWAPWMGIPSASAGTVKDIVVALSWARTPVNTTLLVLTCHSGDDTVGALDCCSASARAVEFLAWQEPQFTERCQTEGSLLVAPEMLRFVHQRNFPHVLPASNGSRKFVWNDAEQQGQWWRPDLVEESTWIRLIRFSDGMGPKATFHSRLSPSGGMHRTMDHTLSLPNFHGDSVDVWFLFLIPSDMFLDQEDAFDGHRWNVAELDRRDYNYTLELHSDKVMDIEQPSFTSPHHAVSVRLQLHLASAMKQVDSLTISFATKIHLRYPSPAIDASTLYQSLALVPPIVMGGSIASQTESVVAAIEPLVPSGHILQFLFSSGTDQVEELEFLTTQVATAPQDDFGWVAILTALFSVLGAALMGYETSKVEFLIES